MKGNQSFHRVALFTLFLQPKGKILTDAFIIKPRSYKDGRPIYLQNEFWIDIDREAKAALKQHLHKHLWRKQASVIDIENEREEGGHIPTIYSGYVTVLRCRMKTTVCWIYRGEYLSSCRSSKLAKTIPMLTLSISTQEAASLACVLSPAKKILMLRGISTRSMKASTYV